MWTQMRTTPARNVGRERDVAVQALEGVHGMLLEVGKGGDRARFRSGRGRGLTDDSRDLGCGYSGKNLVRIALELCPCRAVAMRAGLEVRRRSPCCPRFPRALSRGPLGGEGTRKPARSRDAYGPERRPCI